MYAYLSEKYSKGIQQVAFEGTIGQTRKLRRTLDMMGFPTIYQRKEKRLLCIIDRGMMKKGVWMWLTV